MKNFKQFLTEMAGYLPTNVIFKDLDVDWDDVKRIGEGDNGVAYLYKNNILKITSDSNEAEFFAHIIGKKLKHVANCYDVIEFDFGEEYKDNKTYGDYISKPRYYWAIFKEYLPYQFDDYRWFDVLMFYYKYEDKPDFKHTESDFNKMIEEYRLESMKSFDEDDDDFDPYGDGKSRYEDELEYEIELLKIIRNTILELNSVGIISVSDMQSSNMGIRKDGTIAFIELHIDKDKGLTFPKLKTFK
jgi:hypothetical protein